NRLIVFVANAEIYRQVLQRLPVVLCKEGIPPLTLSGISTHAADRSIRRVIEQKIGKRIAARLAFRGRAGELAVVFKETQSAVIARIEIVLLIVDKLRTELHHMPSVLPRQVIRIDKVVIALRVDTG